MTQRVSPSSEGDFGRIERSFEGAAKARWGGSGVVPDISLGGRADVVEPLFVGHAPRRVRSLYSITSSSERAVPMPHSAVCQGAWRLRKS